MPGKDDMLLAEIEALYRERFADFVAVAASIVGEREAARDVVQEAFATVVRSRRSFRRSGPLAAWIWRIVINAARKKRGHLGRERLPARRPPRALPHLPPDTVSSTAPTPAAIGHATVALCVLIAPWRSATTSMSQTMEGAATLGRWIVDRPTQADH